MQRGSRSARPSSAPPLELARLPDPGPDPPAHWPDGKELKYSWDAHGKPTQWVVVKIKDGKKRHYPYHLSAEGKTLYSTGPDPWPLFFEKAASPCVRKEVRSV
jgi:YD repeat-containing protein